MIVIKGVQRKEKKKVKERLGMRDFLVAPPYTWDPYQEFFNDITLTIFEQSGHTPPLEEPSHFDRELLTWFNNSQ